MLHPFECGLNHFPHDFGVYFWCDHRCWRISPHAPRVGPQVGVQQTLMVLRSGQGQCGQAVGYHHETGLFPFQELFNHHPCNALVVLNTRIFGKHMVNRRMSLFYAHGNHHALAGCQAIGFHHNRRTLGIHISMGFGSVFKHLVFSGANPVPEHEGFGKSLGTFQLRSLLCGAKNAQSVVTKFIDYACCQWGLGTDHRQINVVGLGPFTQRHFVGERYVVKVFLLSCATVAWGQVNALNLRRKIEFPGQCMFSTTTTDHQYFHRAAL